MDIQELKDDEMEFIVGGTSNGSYMTQLSSFLHSNKMGQYFKVTYKSASSISHVCMPANDKAFERVIQRAGQFGSVTLTAPDGTTQAFTADQLKAML